LLCYTIGMNSRYLKTVLARVKTWPKGAQEEAVKALREIEQDFFGGSETKQEMERAHQQALRGEGISLEQIEEEPHF
jgi:hypothetical protein